MSMQQSVWCEQCYRLGSISISTTVLSKKLWTVGGKCMMTSSNGNIFRVIVPLCRGIYRSPVDSSHKGQWRGALMFSLIYAWINCWVNNREAGNLRRHRAHYDVTVMACWFCNHEVMTWKDFPHYSPFCAGNTPVAGDFSGQKANNTMIDFCCCSHEKLRTNGRDVAVRRFIECTGVWNLYKNLSSWWYCITINL